MSDKIQAPLVILRRQQVQARTGLSRSSIYAGISTGNFPAPVQLGEKSVGWVESEIDNWIAERIAARNKKRG